MAVSSAIWQVKLVTDSLGNSACAESGHRQTFKHQTCRLGWFNRMRLWTLRSTEGQISMTCWNHLCHATQIVCFAGFAFVIWSMDVNGSLVISQPSSMVPTKVVSHASPAISITDMIWVSTKQSVWTLRNFGLYSRNFSWLSERNYINNFAQRIRRNMWYEMVFGRLAPTGSHSQTTSQSPQPSGKYC